MTSAEYISIHQHIAQEEGKDPITWDELELLKENPHPRGMITIRRSNNKPYPYNVDSFIKLTETQARDPFTRQPFRSVDIMRAKLYKECMEKFPNYDMTNRNLLEIFQRWKDTYSSECKLDTNTKYLYQLEARGFLQIEDVTNMFKEYFGKGSMENRQKACDELNDKPKGTWFLRNSSITGDEHNIAYVLSVKDVDIAGHYVIIHRIGAGFFVDVAIGRGSSCVNDTQCEIILPCFIDVLDYFIRKGIIQLYQTYI